MWPFLTLLAVAGLVCLHWWWHQRHAGLQRELAQQKTAITALEENHRQSLAHALDQQQALFNSMVEGVLVLGPDGRIQSVNQSLEHLFGITTDIRKQTILEAFRWHELSELVSRLVKEGTVLAHELILPQLNQRSLEVNATTVLNQKGERQGAILVFHDVTRLKQLENTRQEFVANVSHELRTPLSLIKGFVETLLDGAKNDPTVATRFLQTIEKHADRLTYLIEDLLTISRLESGQVIMNFQPVELRDSAARVIEDLQARAVAKKVFLINEVSEGLSVRADADRLEQVIFNLIDNAIKYGRPEGRVIIGSRPQSENLMEVWVQDDGPGIPPAARERVFERFYRVDRARSRETGGTGLGLAIVKHIVQVHGGEVWLNSELGVGTTFFFTLLQEPKDRS